MRDHAAPVLIGYDGSEEADAAIRVAGRLLGPGRAIVAHVWDSLAELLLRTDVQSLTGPMRASARELDDEEAREATELAERGAELAEAAGFQTVPVIARGKPNSWPTLLELAREHDATAVVVGSRGLGGVQSALFGSVSSGLLDHAHLPVLIVPPIEEEVAPGPVLIGYDGSEQADAAIDAAGRLLNGREALVQTVWCSCRDVAAGGVAGAPAGVVVEAVEKLDTQARQRAQQTAERGAELAAAKDLDARGEAVRATGNVWSTLLQTAREKQPAAIVVGSHGRSGVGSAFMGSVSRALVHHAHAPVLVVRPSQG
jgi:nucleotide-binding universal stress UspA family protein